MTTKEIVFRLSPEVAQTVINAVTELPWRIANPIVGEMLRQAQAQQSENSSPQPGGSDAAVT